MDLYARYGRDSGAVCRGLLCTLMGPNDDPPAASLVDRARGEDARLALRHPPDNLRRSS